MKKITFAFVLVLLAAAPDALAQCTRIKFQPGRTDAVIGGKAGANKQACYKLHAREGQRMVAHLTSPGGRARFSILPDMYDGDFLEGAQSVSNWEGVLDSASGAGDFLIVVEAPRAGVTFTLEVAIPPTGRASSSSSRAAVAPCGDFSGVYQTDYGPLRLTRTGDQVRGSYSDDGKEGTVTGTVRGNVLSGRWSDPGRKGSFKFRLDPDGHSFTGSFTNDGSSERSDWNGQ